jgi:hypothetical protein
MYLARAALAIAVLAASASAQADTAFPQGIWAVSDPAGCGYAALFIRVHDGAWEITGTSGETRVQRVLSGVGRDWVTRSESGETWSYHAESPSSALVTEVRSKRRFRLVRCGADSLLGLHAPGL